ncbi:MAG: type III pantothenate kinase, partial [Planctomycetota bacterium]
MMQDLTVAFDVGNTRTKCAVLDKDDITPQFNVPTYPVETLAQRLKHTQENDSNRLPTGVNVVASSVCPEANPPLKTFLEALNVASVYFFDDRVPIPTRMPESQGTGTDRLLCALAAREEQGAPCIAIMAGTAITVDLVDADGQFAGGAICPGYSLCALAMEQGTASLPRVRKMNKSRRSEVLGHDTVTAIQSGIDHFCRGGVNSLIKDISRLIDASPPVVITGGDAEHLMPLNTELRVIHRPQLIFDGIRIALEKQP